MVGPRRACTDRRHRRAQAARPEDPRAGRVDGRARPRRDGARPRPVRRRRGDAPSIWPAIYPELLELVREHRSTIVFVNNRRARRAARAAAERARRARTIARAHHGSLAREERTDRRGAAQGRRAAVPGRDLVARARHRHGRRRPRAPGRVAEVGRRAACSGSAAPGHNVGDTSQGPDLPEVPRRPARVRGRRAADARGRDRDDGRPAQPARRARPADRRDRRRRPRTSRSRVDELYALVTRTTPTPSCRARCSRTCSTCSTAATRREEFGELRPRIVWDRVAGHDPRPQGRARSSRSPTPARSPTAGCSRVNLPDGRRVGELDEEMVYEARPGQTFLLGASSWRIEEIGRDRVIVTPAPGVAGRGAVLEGRRRRAPEGARRGDRRVRALGGRPGRRDARARLRPRRARRAQPARVPARAAGGDARRAVATARSSSSASATRSATGGCASCRPFGGRVHAAWGLALSRPHPRASTASSPTRSGPTTGSSSTSPTPTSRRARSSC